MVIRWTSQWHWSKEIIATAWIFLCFTPKSQQQTCKWNATCQPLLNATCFGAPLPYASTSLIFANDSATQADAQLNLQRWGGLQAAPKCWEVLQPFLCFVYMPKCNSSQIDLYPREQCQKTREPCDIVRLVNGGQWPDFLQCDQPYFISDPLCKGDPYTRLKFSYNGTCEPPLVSIDRDADSYEGVPGCGVQCANPLYTSGEHADLHAFIAAAASICLVCTALAGLTFIIDWKNASRYPALILFFINVCFAVGCIGWLAQFFGSTARQDIVCRRDGTVRSGEPEVSSGESASCVFAFAVIYYSTMAAAAWFVALAYAWHVSFYSFRAGSTLTNKLDGKMAYVHIAAWCFPLVLTIVSLAAQQVDGDSMAGICFVGYVSTTARTLLVLLPIGAALCSGLAFLLMGLRTLLKIKKDSPPQINVKATAKIKETIIRLGIFAGLSVVFVIVTIATQLYMFSIKETWKTSLRNYIICQASLAYSGSSYVEQTSVCSPSSRANLATYYVGVLCYFGAGMMMSSWVWTKASYDAWKRFYCKLFRLPSSEPVKLKKHKVIAQAFQKRKTNGGRLSIDFQSTHDDPLGMKLDLNSMTSNDLSSAFMQAMPKLLRRRGGVVVPVAGTLRRYSDSDVQSIQSVLESSRAQRASNSRAPGDGQDNPKAKKRRRRGRNRTVNPVGVNPSDVQTINDMLTGRRDSALSQMSMDEIRAEIHRRMSNVSLGSHASAQSVALSLDKQLDFEDLEVEDLSESQRPHTIEAVVPAAQLQQLALATYALFTASSLLPADEPMEMSPYHCVPPSRQRSGRNFSAAGAVGNKMKTPVLAYLNHAADSDVSDVSSIE